MAVALIPDRVRGLTKAKNRQYEDLRGLDPNVLSKWLGGHKKMDPSDLKALAEALECTSDYLIGLGEDYGGNFELAAAKMSFAYFHRDPSASVEDKEKCRRIFDNDEILLEDGAPRTAQAWKTVAGMVRLGAGPEPAKFEVLPGRR